jgi:hypothetical protein
MTSYVAWLDDDRVGALWATCPFSFGWRRSSQSLGHAQAPKRPWVVDQPVGLERRPDPVPVRILEREGLRLPDRRGHPVHQRLRQLELRQEFLLGELVEERRLAAPEDVRFRLPLPLDDPAVGDRRPRVLRARLERDGPSHLRVVGESLERGIDDEPRHRRLEEQFVLDRRGLGAGDSGSREHDEGQHDGDV